MLIHQKHCLKLTVFKIDNGDNKLLTLDRTMVITNVQEPECIQLLLIEAVSHMFH
jgi:hypothetical protein